MDPNDKSSAKDGQSTWMASTQTIAQEEGEEGAGKGDTSACGKVVKFAFSTAGLFVLNTVYLMIGAAIFHTLEQPNEMQECISGAVNYNRVENASVSLMVDVLERVATSGILQQEGGADVVRSDYKDILRQFSLGVLSANYKVSDNCSTLGEDDGIPSAWSWIGALEFAMTVTTTIGYGHIYPKTFWGRMACIAYGMLGIPMMLLCLATVGEVMAKIFRYIYATFCCLGCCGKKPKKKDRQKVSDGRKTSLAGYDDEYESDNDDSDDDYDEDEDEDVAVPLTISMVTLLLFTSFGAAVFSTWEGWSFVDSTYFCFITYSTIGLGDMVPGMDGKDSNQEKSIKLFVTGIYEVVGMAWLSMCFQLMQNEMVAKMKWLAKKCGLEKEKTPNHSTEEKGQDNAVKPFTVD